MAETHALREATSPMTFTPSVKVEFLNVTIIDFGGLRILCHGGFPMHCSIPGLYPVDATSTPPPEVTARDVSGHYQMSPGGGGKIAPSGEQLS